MAATFKPEEDLDTPYMKARQVWDNRLGSARVQASNWRLLSFCLIGIIAIMSFGLIRLGSQSKVVPYVVEVGPRGDFQNKGVATEHTYSPSPALERYFVENFVRSLRTISSDPVINEEKFATAYNFLTQQSAKILTQMHERNDPLVEARTKTRTVDIETIIPVGKNSYQIDWFEIEYDKTGERTKLQPVRGVFTLVSRIPTSDEETRKNPLGLYIDHFSWQSR